MLQKFDKYNWLLLIIGVCYVLLAFVDIKTKAEHEEHIDAFKEAMGYEECEGCKDSFVHVVIPTKKREDNEAHKNDK